MSRKGIMSVIVIEIKKTEYNIIHALHLNEEEDR